MPLRAGFTLLDVLVSIAVIAVLIGMLMPRISIVHESARRVVCQSNARQIGIGIMTFANDHTGNLPGSIYLSNGPNRGNSQPQSMDVLRLQDGKWDGLGILYGQEYTTAPKVFYCPSHRGEKPFSTYAKYFVGTLGEIVGNYHYRGEGPVGHGPNAGTTHNLDHIDPAFSSLLADGMQLESDFNHRVGANFFRADLSVHWFSDPSATVSLPKTKAQSINDREYVPALWNAMDASANAE